MRRLCIGGTLLFVCLLAAASAAFAKEPGFTTVPDVIRPGKYYSILLTARYAGNATLTLVDSGGVTVHTIFSGYPLIEGENTLSWDGMRMDETCVETGDYSLRLSMDDGSAFAAPLRIGAPYPLITQLQQSDAIIEENAVTVSFVTSEPGTVEVMVNRLADGNASLLAEMDVGKGANSFQWRGMLNNVRVPAGDYALVLTLKASNGTESTPYSVYVSIGSAHAVQTEVMIIDATPTPVSIETPAPAPTPPPASQPYSNQSDGSFWAMTPGETDDAAIWNILMQPITVYDGGIKAGVKGHAYLMENPDGSGRQVAQLHTQSQGVHVVGEVNEHGYVLVEAFSNYDREYYPATEEEQANAFALKQGYVLAAHLKTVEVMTDMALLIDKLSQRMYLFIDGVRVTELLISTGVWKKVEDMLFETVPGEFITVSHTGSLVDGNMTSDMAIRINGGILFHEVPHKTRADGSYDYSSFEAYLGTKQSHGCIRVQRLKNADGYNQRWLWENFKRGKPYKVIIWDDKSRADTPAIWYPNPKN